MKKIFFLADDDSDDAALFCEALEEIGTDIECRWAKDGNMALEMLADNKLQRPQIIFLDINMPGINGFQCLVALKNNDAYKDTPVIIYSTSSHQREATIALDLGALFFFTKPVDFSVLKNILKVIANNLDGNMLEAVKHFDCIKSRKENTTNKAE